MTECPLAQEERNLYSLVERAKEANAVRWHTILTRSQFCQKVIRLPKSKCESKDERFVSRYIANAIYCIFWKYRDIAIFRKYRDILTIFSVHDIGQF